MLLQGERHAALCGDGGVQRERIASDGDRAHWNRLRLGRRKIVDEAPDTERQALYLLLDALRIF